jgi:hypothetical protein
LSIVSGEVFERVKIQNHLVSSISTWTLTMDMMVWSHAIVRLRSVDSIPHPLAGAVCRQIMHIVPKVESRFGTLEFYNNGILVL